ncbi:MAG: VapE domain-containing protein, partial [Anaerolineales bacterium]
STDGMDRIGRCLVIVGTSRRDDFVKDTAGNGHLLPVMVNKADLALLEAEKFQLWAEAYHMVANLVAQGLPPVDFQEAKRLAEQVLEDFEPEGLWSNDPNLLRYLSGKPERFSTDDALRKVDHKRTGTGNLNKDRSEMCRSLEQNGFYKKPTHIPGKRSKPRRWFPRAPKLKKFRDLMPATFDWDVFE